MSPRGRDRLQLAKGLGLLAASYVRLDRVDDARREISVLMELDPKLSLQTLANRLLVQQLPDTGTLLTDLREAGVQEQ